MIECYVCNRDLKVGLRLVPIPGVWILENGVADEAGVVRDRERSEAVHELCDRLQKT